MVNRTALSFEERVAQVLLEGGFLTEQQVAQAHDSVSADGTGLLDALVSQGMLAQETLVTVLSFQLRIPVVDLRHVEVDPEAVSLVPEEYARQYGVMPTGFDPDGSLRIATRMPNDFQLSSELSSLTGRQTKFVLAIGGKLDDLIDRIYGSAPPKPVSAPPQTEPESQVITFTPMDAPPGGGVFGAGLGEIPAVQAVDMVTLQAIRSHASDIHMVPTSDSSKVMFRLDGILTEMVVIPLTRHESMISRIKVQAGMDILEGRRPQDGNFSVMFGEKKAEFRVATIGTTWGEMMVIRVLDTEGGMLDLEALGLDTQPLHIWRQLLGIPYGMLLVSGPTGSGKTTTLYASVAELVNQRGNIMAIENPIEYRMEGINQIQVNRAAGIDFPAGLRSIMRLDPDIILVGEIRDEETAKTAVNAALTGHLVLASIHSNDAPSSIIRLLDLGVEPFLVATAVIGAFAQRLVRKVDPQCQILTEPTATEAMAYEQEMQEPAPPLMVGQGCNFCNGTGFSGRTGVFEVMTVDENIRKLIASGVSGAEIRTQALNNGMVPLRRSGMLKAREGTTTLGEVFKGVFFIE